MSGVKSAGYQVTIAAKDSGIVLFRSMPLTKRQAERLAATIRYQFPRIDAEVEKAPARE